MFVHSEVSSFVHSFLQVHLSTVLQYITLTFRNSVFGLRSSSFKIWKSFTRLVYIISYLLVISYVIFLKGIKAEVEERDREFKPGPYCKVKFEDGAQEIRLIIPEGTISDWKMSRLNQLLVHIMRSRVILHYIKWRMRVYRCPKRMLTSTQATS